MQDLPSAERWKQISDALDAVLDAPPAAQEARLDAVCDGDDDLRREVETFLRAEAPAFLEVGAAACASELLTRAGQRSGALPLEEDAFEAQTLGAGERVGPYRLTGILGRGGMSTVYRAERADGQFERAVAVKVLRRTLALGRDLHRRFLAERQILASLSHPHVAQVFDGGLTDDGQPYLTMELVDGRPLTNYCEENACTVERRLALFEDVLAAVEHAHQHLVVHRDLKPANVLVSEADASAGQVKLLDFGIAKLLDPSATGGTSPALHTRTGAFLMTPAYAAPEQVRGGAVTTATDVYALGVLLYELLAGRRPYEIEERTPLEMARMICEEDPPRPSEATIRPERRNVLRGDLDAVAMKALRKEPSRRYASAAEFAADLRRYREGLPVEARAATWRYRAGKFMRRHRLGVGAATLVLLVLVASAAVLGVQARSLAAERDRAQSEAATAEEVSSFLTSLFTSSYPENARGETITARMLLARGLERADTLQGQPAAQARMLNAIGSAYRQLSLFDEAESALQRALDVRASLLDADHPDLAQSREELALFLRDRGRYAAADSLLRQVAAARRSHFGPQHESVARSLRYLTYVQRQQGQYAAAEASIREALDIEEARYDGPNLQTAESLYNLAGVLRDRGHLDEAAPVQQRSLDMVRALTEGPHPGVVGNLNNLAIIRKAQGNLQEAAALYEEALGMTQTLFGDVHDETAIVLGNLAGVRTAQGQHEAAERLRKRALHIERGLHEPVHPHIAHQLHSLGSTYYERDQFTRADSLYREALALWRQVYDGPHARSARTLAGLGRVARQRGRLQAAEAHFRESLRQYEAVHREDHPTIARARHRLGEVLLDGGRLAEAEPLLLGSERTLRAALAASHSHVSTTRQSLVRLYDTWDRPQQASAWRDSLVAAR